MKILWRIVLFLGLTFGSHSSALGPQEVMADPLLQTRALALYDALRCVKCRSETIASSNADWAVTARAAVRERLLAGDADQDVLDFFQARYGDYVLMNPPLSVRNAALWLAGPALLLIGGIFALAHVRRQRVAVTPDGLSSDEQARLKQLLGD